MPGFVEYLDLTLPEVPEELLGLRLAHLTDLHIHGHRRRHGRIAAALKQLNPDLVLLTGDYVTRWWRHEVAFEAMGRICAAVDPPRGIFGVFGNHDGQPLRHRLEGLPVTWLNNTVHRFADLPLEIWGSDTRYDHTQDGLALAEQLGPQSTPATGDAPDKAAPPSPRPVVRLLLSHLPSFLPTAADLGADVMFSGHTHGGQIRLPGGRALRNSTDLPLHLTSGLLRHRNTICYVSRGLGEVLLPIRFCCPPQLPVYTIRRGPLPGEYTDQIVNVRPW